MFLKLRVGDHIETFNEDQIKKVILREKEATIIQFDHDQGFTKITDPDSLNALAWYLNESPNCAFDVVTEYKRTIQSRPLGMRE